MRQLSREYFFKNRVEGGLFLPGPSTNTGQKSPAGDYDKREGGQRPP